MRLDFDENVIKPMLKTTMRHTNFGFLTSQINTFQKLPSGQVGKVITNKKFNFDRHLEESGVRCWVSIDEKTPSIRADPKSISRNYLGQDEEEAYAAQVHQQSAQTASPVWNPNFSECNPQNFNEDPTQMSKTKKKNVCVLVKQLIKRTKSTFWVIWGHNPDSSIKGDDQDGLSI
ncbi:hypothetical protein QE152_g7405 [Popillia japonica]|uniref:Uncharacterized protein n=1 Tax=Popillia japonica TaxID=7064 RepID=A0AAW1MEY6_POPJA